MDNILSKFCSHLLYFKHYAQKHTRTAQNEYIYMEETPSVCEFCVCIDKRGAQLYTLKQLSAEASYDKF